MTDDSPTVDEVSRLVVELALELAQLRGVDLEQREPITVISRTRRSLRETPTHDVIVQLVYLFGNSADDHIQVRLKRVTEPVNADGSLVTSQSVAVDQTGDQADQSIEEKNK